MLVAALKFLDSHFAPDSDTDSVHRIPLAQCASVEVSAGASGSAKLAAAAAAAAANTVDNVRDAEL